MDAIPAPPWQRRRARPRRAASAAFARARRRANRRVASPAIRCRAPETLHPSLWLGHQLGRTGSGCGGERLRRASTPSCPAAAGRAGRWPSCCCRIAGVGEIRLLAPALVAAQRAGRLVMFFDPPAALAAAALAGLGFDVEELLVVHTRARVIPGSDSLWALEQALKSGHVGAVVAWLPPRLRAERLRRLQLAAHQHDGPAFVMREAAVAGRPTASPLRLGAAGGRRRPLAGARPEAARPAARGAAFARAADRPVGGGAAALGQRERACGGAARGHLRQFRVSSPARFALPSSPLAFLAGSLVLWVALHFPLLSLESFAATLLAADASEASAEPAIALVDEHRISAANAAAQAQGVKPGLKRATALALAPRIVLGQADPARDAEAMLPLAHAALAFTPQVSLQPACEPGAAADTVLLEVQASLRYFGGIDRLLQRLQRAPEPLGHARPHRDRGDGAGRGDPRPRRAAAALQ